VTMSYLEIENDFGHTPLEALREKIRLEEELVENK